MTRRIILTVLAVSFVAAPMQKTASDFSADRFKAHVTFLADDLLEGREAGTRGHEIAARYIASQFALSGVKPGGADGSYFQPVDLLEAAQAGAKPTFGLTTPRGTESLEYGRSVMMRGPLTAGPVSVDAPLVFVGYGMKDAAVGYDDYQGLDVRGKIAVVLWGSPKDMDSEIGAHLRSEQARVAADHGAAAMVIVQTRLGAATFPWAQVVQFLSEPRTAWVQKDGTPFDPNGGLKVGVAVEPTAAPALFAAAPKSLTEILDEADKPGGRPKGFAMNASASITVDTSVRRYSSPEVIGMIEGADPKLRNEYVVLMGHADHIGINKGQSGDRINNGALDNAAGVATLLEVARAFAMPDRRPRRSILVVANTAEEKGLLGAEYFAHYPTVPIDRITAAIDLDMPMLLYNFTDVVAYGGAHSTLEAALRKAGAAMGITVSPDPMPEQAVFVRSDHYAMVKAGVPAVMLATGMAGGGAAAWAGFLGTRYHQPSDDLTQPILWNAGARFAELNYRVVRELADADVPARWYAGDYFGNLFAPKSPRVPKPASR
jgi:Zn-dependent M28 family amino/carboxypeptidase